MNIKELSDKVEALTSFSQEWLKLHESITEYHKMVKEEGGREAALALHESLMNKIESEFSQHIDLEIFRKVRLQEYNKLLLRECEVGGSLCVDTLYELTQRELEAGRMSPTHEFIDISIQATASDHYSREQLNRQQDKIKKLRQNSALNKLTGLFKSG